MLLICFCMFLYAFFIFRQDGQRPWHLGYPKYIRFIGLLQELHIRLRTMKSSALLSTPPRRAWTCNACARRFQYASRAPRAVELGFFAKSREKRLEFRAGLYCNSSAAGDGRLWPEPGKVLPADHNRMVQKYIKYVIKYENILI